MPGLLDTLCCVGLREDTASVHPKITAEMRRARKRAGLTQAQLAQKVGVGLRTASEWERTGNVPVDRREDLAAALGVKAALFEEPDEQGLDMVQGTDPELGEIRLLVPREALDKLSVTERAEAEADLTARFLALYREFNANR